MPRGRTIPTDVRRKIREEVNAGTNRTDIAMKYGISEAAVSRIANERIESAANQIEALKRRKEMLISSIREEDRKLESLKGAYEELMEGIKLLMKD